MIHPLLYKARVLFVIENCSHCSIWKEFVDRMNLEVSHDKMIEIIYCDKYHDFGIIENPKLRLFYPYFQGSYPTMFFDGIKISGTNSLAEAEATLMVLFDQDFNNPTYNPNMFNKSCSYVKRGIFKNEVFCKNL